MRRVGRFESACLNDMSFCTKLPPPPTLSPCLHWICSALASAVRKRPYARMCPRAEVCVHMCTCAASIRMYAWGCAAVQLCVRRSVYQCSCAYAAYACKVAVSRSCLGVRARSYGHRCENIPVNVYRMRESERDIISHWCCDGLDSSAEV